LSTRNVSAIAAIIQWNALIYFAADSVNSSRHASVSMPIKPALRASRAQSLPMPMEVSTTQNKKSREIGVVVVVAGGHYTAAITDHLQTVADHAVLRDVRVAHRYTCSIIDRSTIW
jgi:hypothetical protein